MILVKFTRYESDRPTWVNASAVSNVFRVDDTCTSIVFNGGWVHVTEDVDTVIARLISEGKDVDL